MCDLDTPVRRATSIGPAPCESRSNNRRFTAGSIEGPATTHLFHQARCDNPLNLSGCAPSESPRRCGRAPLSLILSGPAPNRDLRPTLVSAPVHTPGAAPRIHEMTKESDP
jgi:hypothetical protein